MRRATCRGRMSRAPRELLMARFLSEEWIDSIRVDDARMIESSVEISVIGGPDGDVTWNLTSGSGTLSAALGAADGPMSRSPSPTTTRWRSHAASSSRASRSCRDG